MKDSLMEMARKELMIKMKYIGFLNEGNRSCIKVYFSKNMSPQVGRVAASFTV